MYLKELINEHFSDSKPNHFQQSHYPTLDYCLESRYFLLPNFKHHPISTHLHSRQEGIGCSICFSESSYLLF